MTLKEQADLAEGMRWVEEVDRLRDDLARARRETLRDAEYAVAKALSRGGCPGCGGGKSRTIYLARAIDALRSLASTPEAP